MDQLPSEVPEMYAPSAPYNGAGFMYGEPSMLYISWAAPESSGSTPVTNYLLTLTPNDLQSEEHYIDVPVMTFSKLIDCISIQATVKASNNNGATYGPEYTFPLITYVNPPYSPPSSAQAVPLEPGFASVSWTAPEVAPEGNAYYVITTNSSSDSDPVLMFRTDNITQLSYTVPELNAESIYYFTVQVQNQVGTSPATVTNTIVPQ
jgi:hypothetical protein